MIGIDTNVLLRLVLADDPKQAELAESIFSKLDKANPGYVNVITLCEYVWSLHRGLKKTKAEVIIALRALVDSRDLIVEDEQLVIEAIELTQESQGEFADILIARRNSAFGCQRTITFDRKAAKTVSGMELAE